MAEPVGSLRVELEANIIKFETGMKKAGEVLSRWTEGNQRSAMAMSRAHDEALKMNAAIGKTATTTGSALGNLAKMAISLYAVKAAVGFVTDSLKAQGEQEAAINKLNLALANQGLYTDATSKSLIAYSGALQDVSTFADEVILDGMAILASFGMNEDQIKKTTKVALDFAAATGMELPAAMNLLGKAYAGNTAALGRYGIVIDKSIPQAQKFDAVIAQLGQRFGGQAQEATKTYAGQMAVLGNQFGEVQEAVGKFLGELTGSDAPFSVAINACKSLAKFLSEDLTTALSEFRAQWLEWMADLAESSESDAFLGAVRKNILGQFGLTNALDGGKEAAAAYRKAADDLRNGITDVGVAAVVTAGKAKPLTEEQKAAAAAALKAREAFEKLVDGYRSHNTVAGQTAAAQKQLQVIIAALGPLAQVSARDLLAATDTLNKMGTEGQAAANKLHAEWEIVNGRLLATREASKQAAEGFEILIAEGQEIEVVRETIDSVTVVLDDMAFKLEQMAEGNFFERILSRVGIASVTQGLGVLADTLDEIDGLLEDLGVSAESSLRELATGLADAAEGAFNLAAGFASMNPAQMIAGLAGVAKAVKGLVDSESGLNRFVGGMLLLGPIGGTIAAIFGGPAFDAAQRLNHELMIMRGEFINAAGGLYVLEAKAKAAGVSLDAMWNARTVAEYEAAVGRVNAAIALHEEAVNKTKAAMDRWGVSISQIGPEFAGQLLGEQLLEIYQDFRLLEAAGVDVAELMAGPMGAAIGDLVQQAIASGAALPLAMQPWIEELARSGQLIDENGQAITDVSNLTFTETLEAGVARLITQIENLVRALLGIPSEIDTMIKVNVQTTHTGTPPPGLPLNTDGTPDFDGDPSNSFAQGGIGDFGAGALAMLHGQEEILPVDQSFGVAAMVEEALKKQDQRTVAELRGLREEMALDRSRLPLMLRDAAMLLVGT